MSTITLVACVSKKLDRPAPAAELYTSPWFVKARRYAELTSDRWLILSAKYGLVEPGRVIEPYNETLQDKAYLERHEWSRQIALGLFECTSSVDDDIVILAGKYYRHFLGELLIQAGYRIQVPMMGLGIGQQLAWLDERIDALSPALSHRERE